MTRRRPPFDTLYVHKVVKDKKGKTTKIMAGGPPKKLTKGLRRQLIKTLHQNPEECQRQLAALGLSGDCYKELGLK